MCQSLGTGATKRDLWDCQTAWKSLVSSTMLFTFGGKSSHLGVIFLVWDFDLQNLIMQYTVLYIFYKLYTDVLYHLYSGKDDRIIILCFPCYLWVGIANSRHCQRGLTWGHFLEATDVINCWVPLCLQGGIPPSGSAMPFSRCLWVVHCLHDLKHLISQFGLLRASC